jgi:hypothetical protein
MIPVMHNYSAVAGKTLLWDTLDSQQRFEKHKQNPVTNHRLKELGYLDSEITYKFNTHGFRTDEFDSKIDIVCFGCSFTMGTGVRVQDTWPMQLQTLTSLRVANLGHAGSSNDTAYRFASHYLPLLRPRLAIWLQTDRHRLELLDQHDNVSLNIMASDTQNPCYHDNFTKIWFSSPQNHDLNLEKNTRAFKNLCSELNIEAVVLDRDQVINDGCARDLAHPGPLANQTLCKQIYQQIS